MGQYEILFLSDNDNNINSSNKLKLLADGTLQLTGDLTVSNTTTISGNVQINGDLSVGGSSTSITSTNITVNDKLIKLGQGNTNSDQDLGLIFTRGDGSATNTNNTGLIFDGSANEFGFISCLTEDGTTDGNITVNDYYNVHTGGLITGQSGTEKAVNLSL